MKRFMIHEKMRDVCAEALEAYDQNQWKVQWWNLLGTVDDPNPFPIGSGSRLAIEVIKLKSLSGWMSYDSLAEARQASRQRVRSDLIILDEEESGDEPR